VECSNPNASAAVVVPHSHDCTTTSPIYEPCGPAAAAASSSSAAAERPVPRPRSTYGKYHLENVKNINAESKPCSSLNANDEADEEEEDSFCH